jgi:hypothetical protein
MTIVVPDLREDGVERTSNVNRFLVACSSYGLSSRDLFKRDDLKKGTSESLARVAHTLIALIKFVDAPSETAVVDMSRLEKVDESRSNSKGGDALVPFPRAVSGEHGPASSSSSLSIDIRPMVEPPGQSDVEGSTRRARPSSYDEMGRPRRSRFEGIVNLGVAASDASASDLMNRDSVDGSVVRKTLVIKEEGKPPTQFVGSHIHFWEYDSRKLIRRLITAIA